MISSNSDHKAILICFHCLNDGIINFLEKAIQEREIFDEMFVLLWVILFSLKIFVTDIAKINNIYIKFFL